MYNAAIEKFKLSFILITFSLLCSCGDNDSQKAAHLLEKARSAYENNQYSEALTLIDSIKTSYPREIEVRREALHLSTRINEGLTIMHLEKADSLTAVLSARGDSLGRLMKFVKNPIEGYWTAGNSTPTAVSTSDGIQARMSPDGNFYIISSLRSKKIQSTAITISNPDGEKAVSATIAYDGERNDRSMGAEVITFMGAECDSIGKFIFNNSGRNLTLTFKGAGSWSMPLPSNQANEAALVYEYATTIRKFKLASLEKERLTRTLEIARSQAARTFVEKDSVK